MCYFNSFDLLYLKNESYCDLMTESNFLICSELLFLCLEFLRDLLLGFFYYGPLLD